MNKYLLIIPIVLFVAFSGCKPQPKEQTSEGMSLETMTSDTTQMEPERDFPTLFQQILGAHGGLSTWNQYVSLTYDLEATYGENTSMQSSTLNLHTRYEHTQYADYQIGYNGESYWYYADSIPEDHPDPKFYINLQFYFFAIPFVLADKGVNYEILEPRVVAGKTYDVLKATFKSGIGVAPEDQYILYTDPESHELHMLLYSVTYFDESRATSYNALIYDEWQAVQGLLVPQSMTSYVWDSETQSLGEQRGSKVFSNVTFSKAPPSPETFEKPEGAVISS